LPQACVGCSLRAAGTPRHCLLVLRQKSSQIHYGFMADKALVFLEYCRYGFVLVKIRI